LRGRKRAETRHRLRTLRRLRLDLRRERVDAVHQRDTERPTRRITEDQVGFPIAVEIAKAGELILRTKRIVHDTAADRLRAVQELHFDETVRASLVDGFPEEYAKFLAVALP
jgi:hypothetical protein